ncbi:hypothetical protein FACS1894162_1520 [Bacteroidia bacterium]|nr:hypothetical protein FACS1894162_1520 [Bacteroidia bacterium]
MKNKIQFILTAFIAMFAMQAQSANVIPLVTITSSSGSVSGMPVANIINGSGMSVLSVAGTHDNQASGATSWSCNYQWSDISVTFDLGAAYQVAEMYVWNFNTAGETNKGMKNVKIQYSSNNSTWATVAAPTNPGYTVNTNYPFQLAQASGANNLPATPIVLNVNARYIRIVSAQIGSSAEGNWGGNATGLSEVLFTTSDDLSAGYQVEVDASQIVNTCGNLVFGGAQIPSFTHSQTIFPLFADAGMNTVRADFWIESIVPALSSVEEYYHNINDCQNPDKWDYSNLELMVLAKKAGMTTMAIIAYCPSWLSYNGKTSGAPKDMAVYTDIIRKIYSRYHSYIDYVEFYNEPGYFFSTESSPYTSTGQALADMYLACYEVVQSVSPGKPMGGLSVVTQSDGGVGGSTNRDFFGDSRINASNFNFYSHHVYSDYGIETSKETVTRVKNELSTFGFGHLPVWFTEWSSSINSAADSIYYSGTKSHTFVGKCLLNWMKDGLTGAHHWNFLQAVSIGGNEAGSNRDSHGMYAWNNTNKTGYLLPKAYVFKLLSRSLGLGKGENQVLSVNNSVADKVNLAAFENSEGKVVVAAVNESNAPVVIRLKINGLNNIQKAEQYTVTYTQTGEIPSVLTLTSGSTTEVSIEIPASSVSGIKFDN